MRIVQVGQYPLSADCIRGGVEASVYGLARELVAQGHEVHVFDLPRIDGANSIEPIAGEDGQRRGSIHRYANSGSHNVDQMKRADDMLHDILVLHPDVVHVHGTGDVPAYLYKAIKVANIPLMLTIHGLLRVEKQNALRKAISERRWVKMPKAIYQYIRQSRVECHLLETANRAIVDTGYLLDALKKYPVRHLPKLHVIPQGANEKFYDDSRTICDNLRSKSILCVGAFGVRKSQIELVRAFEQLRSHGVEAKLVLCGVVAEQSYFNQLKSIVAASDYNADIEIKENLPFEQLMQEYQHATIFALHSQEESQGIVLAEAMAMGLPVVSTRVGGIPYVVEDGVSGILTEYGDVEATAEALDRLLTEVETYQRMSLSAMKASENYKWSNIAVRIVELYTNQTTLNLLSRSLVRSAK